MVNSMESSGHKTAYRWAHGSELGKQGEIGISIVHNDKRNFTGCKGKLFPFFPFFCFLFVVESYKI